MTNRKVNFDERQKKSVRYGATFAYYSEEYGHFDTMRFEVQATDEFEARKLAWEAYDNCADKPFMSCVRLCGVVWTASTLDVQDYFNSAVAYDKMAIKITEFCDYANDAIADAKAIHLGGAAQDEAENRHVKNSEERSGSYASIHATTIIARDFYKAQDLIPPQVYEEIYYAKQLADELSRRGEYDKEAALYKIIEKAEKWDEGAIFSLTQLFKGGSIYMNDKQHNYDEYYADLLMRGGVCPVYENEAARNSYHIESRYINAARVERLSQLPTFSDAHVIIGGCGLDYECKTLVLKPERMKEPYQTPENLLWTPCDTDGDGEPLPPIGKEPNAEFCAINLITGDIESWKRSDFHGILRPEFTDSIDFKGLREQYAAERLCEELAKRDAGELDDEQDDELDEDNDGELDEDNDDVEFNEEDDEEWGN